MKRLFLLSVLFMWTVCCFGCGESESVLKEMDTAAEEVPEEEPVQEEDDLEETIFVDVCGAVQQPGVYELPAGSRGLHRRILRQGRAGAVRHAGGGNGGRVRRRGAPGCGTGPEAEKRPGPAAGGKAGHGSGREKPGAGHPV